MISFDQQKIVSTDQADALNPSLGVDPTKQAFVTIDVDAPISSVSPLRLVQTNQDFILCWSGTDLGSGIASFNIYSQTNNGPWGLWVGGTTNTCGPFHGAIGSTYGFFSVARDMVGNVESVRYIADTTTTISTNSPPVTGPQLNVSTSGENNLVLTWPANAVGFVLQSTTNLAPAVWVNVSTGFTTANGLIAITNPISSTQQFFRLFHQ
jgi:hypothetical protein